MTLILHSIPDSGKWSYVGYPLALPSPFYQSCCSKKCWRIVIFTYLMNCRTWWIVGICIFPVIKTKSDLPNLRLTQSEIPSVRQWGSRQVRSVGWDHDEGEKPPHSGHHSSRYGPENKCVNLINLGLTFCQDICDSVFQKKLFKVIQNWKTV